MALDAQSPKKPYFVRVVLTSEEYKYPISSMVWDVDEKAAGEQAMKGLLFCDFWPEDGGYYDRSGQVHLSVSRVEELSQEQAALFGGFI